VFCRCEQGCDADGNCLTPRVCPADECAENCVSCTDTEEASCYVCAEGYELSAFPPATCVACDGECTNNVMFATPDACECPVGYYWEPGCNDCQQCHNSCCTCYDGGNIDCTSCFGEQVLLPNTGYCSDFCPTGFAPTNAGTCAKNTDLSWKFSFNKPTTEYLNDTIVIKGGFHKNDHYIDDPYPIADRGLWFDGMYKHLEVDAIKGEQLALNHSFTLEFFLKSYCGDQKRCSLFANYKSPYDNIGGSLYNYHINKGYLTFGELPSTTSLANSGTLEQKTWAHVAITVDFEEVSRVRFYQNGVLEYEFPEVFLFVVDNPNLGHYIGGIRHDWKLEDAFEGFIYEFVISNYAKVDFSTTLFKGEACAGGCDICTEYGTEEGTLCPSCCEFYEK